MKKLLSISVIAALTVLPMAANAEEGDREVTALAAATGGSTTNLATTSYVQGAYTAVKTQFDKMVTDTAVGTNGSYIDAGKTVSHNLKELDTAVKANTDAIGDTAYTGGTLSAAIAGLQTSAGNLGSNKVDNADNFTDESNSNLIKNKTVVAAIQDTASQVDTNTGAISALNGSDSTTGSVAKSIKDKVETLDATESQTAGADGLALSITEVDGVITGISGSIAANTYDSYGSASAEATRAQGVEGTLGSLNTTDKTDLVSAINEVNTAVSTLTTDAGNTYQTLSNSNVANGTYDHITQGQGVGTNLVNLDTAVSVIENKQIPIVSDWSTNAVTNTKISQLTGTVDCDLTANASNPACTTPTSGD